MRKSYTKIFRNPDKLQELLCLYEFHPQWRSVSALARRFKCHYSSIFDQLVKHGIYEYVYKGRVKLPEITIRLPGRGRCKRCEILLTSESAGDIKDGYCEECSNVVDKTR